MLRDQEMILQPSINTRDCQSNSWFLEIRGGLTENSPYRHPEATSLFWTNRTASLITQMDEGDRKLSCSTRCHEFGTWLESDKLKDYPEKEGIVKINVSLAKLISLEHAFIL
jgi:hypothetical protein